MSFLSLLGPILSGIGAITASGQQSKQNAAMDNTINQIFGQETGVNNQIEQGVSGLQGTAGSYLSNLPQLVALMNQLSGGAGAQAPGAASSYIQNAMSPGALAGTSGVNAGGLTNNALKYLGNTGGTNLSQVTPGVLNLYSSMATNGLNPQVQSNAQNQLQQNFQTSLDSITSNLLPGQSGAAATQDAQNNLLTQSTNLAGNLAGQNQNVRAQGAAGLTGAASGLDAQTMQYLMQAAGLGTNYSQTVLGNEAAGAGFGQNILQALNAFTGQGNQLNEFGLSTLGSLGQNLGQQGEYFSGLAANAPQTNPWTALGSIASGINWGGGGGGGTSGPLPVQFGPGSGINLPIMAPPQMPNFGNAQGQPTTVNGVWQP